MSSAAPTPSGPPPEPARSRASGVPGVGTGWRRIATMVRLWRNEAREPEPFYRALAGEAVAELERRHGPLAGQLVVDLGCGPGFYTDAFRGAGAVVVPIDGNLAELALAGDAPKGAVVGDAGRLPLPPGSVDGVFCSNLLEHTPAAEPVAAELARVLRPSGWAYVSWTNWYSPWGGHEMSPWHLLGPSVGPRLYERLHGPPRKNRYGEGLFPVHVGPTVRLFRSAPGLRVDVVEPRYWPRLRFICRIPVLREVLTWNCVIRLTRSVEGGEDEGAPLGIEGWLTDDQARRLRRRAAEGRAGGRIVEIGSFRGRSTVCLAGAAAPGVEVVAVDPHAGTDRGPREWVTTAEHGESDHEAFHANLRAAGVEDRVRHVRQPSQEALHAVAGPISLVFVDGAHRFRPARDDIRHWGERVEDGGTLLVHDSFSSVGVTLALLTTMLWTGRFRYVGRVGSLTEYRREAVPISSRPLNALRQVAQLPWFARNLVVKGLLVAGLRPLTRPLGHRSDAWPH